MLQIENISSFIGEKPILKNFNLNIKENETHVLFGPNGCGKSTLANIIAGSTHYDIKEGSIYFKGENILTIPTNLRALKGIFLCFQNPLEIPGLNNFEYLHLIYNEKCKFLKKEIITPLEFFAILEPFLFDLEISKDFLNRNLNENFSGGEKKKNEILQMLLLSPDFIILDELDSGVDIDSLKKICSTIIKYRKKNSAFLIITHSLGLLKNFNVSFFHLMVNGELIKTSHTNLYDQIEKYGYSSFIK